MLLQNFLYMYYVSENSVIAMYTYSYFVASYGTDLMQCHTCEWHAMESNPVSTKISSIHHQVWVDALVKYAPRKHSQQACTYRILNF